LEDKISALENKVKIYTSKTPKPKGQNKTVQLFSIFQDILRTNPRMKNEYFNQKKGKFRNFD